MEEQDRIPATSNSLMTGMLELLLGRQPDSRGISTWSVGLVMLAIFFIALAATVRSFMRMRGWIKRSRTLSPRQIGWQITPHLLIPVIILVVIYRYLGIVFLDDPCGN